ncbi:bifunctional cytochrome P450/NADPH--P450 reductase 2 [Streptomyces inusitatus]|uniref:Bifunctional cytochrome P450/NADPH--P450 reductase n=1 Tax=Streptomyces inusitatus TaxID=68221 RepID=A0A918PND8_9ACTN|nr:cytochrome P450 [Streptomyces inusitatus]GGZ14854.1 bifunctional cytochrome P450/NADPH--P450 reductase 2 [Streptomyces inusitatus]
MDSTTTIRRDASPSTSPRTGPSSTGPNGTVPERTPLPFFGHALSVPTDAFTQYALREARALGPIFNLRFFGEDALMVSGGDLVAELCDESRFRKSAEPLATVREFAGDGLFTAFGDEPNWRKAHNILMPAFSFNALRAYHPTMMTVARRLLAKWDAQAGTPVEVAEDMTRLTLDTIGLCGFGHDFGSFDRGEQHPFIASMVRALDHAQRKTGFIPGLDFLYARAESRQQANILAMNRLADDIVRARRAAGSEAAGAKAAGPGAADPEGGDLLDLMLNAVDKETGEPLDDTNIRYQLLTFLIAGHETTSGSLSFALYYLLKNPAVLAEARAETDALWGDDPDPDPSYEDVGRLALLRRVLNESMRLWPTAPAFAVEPLEDTVIGGRHPVRKGQAITIITPALHRDPGWGDNTELFDPDRFTPENMERRPGHLYKPFGNGERSCIGRQFALHEATLLLGLIVHRYRLLDHEDYRLRIKETLTLKPDGFTLTPVRRTADERRPAVAVAAAIAGKAETEGVEPRAGLRAPGTTLTVLHGSNLGTSRGLAAELAAQGARYGFTTSLAPLDEAVDALDPEHPVLIVASSYNGRPTDDAARFVAWLEAGGAPAALPYAVLGIGDRNWSATYQRVPTLIDRELAAAGGVALAERAAVDVSMDVGAEVERWSAGVWTALLDRYGVPADADADDTAGETAAGPRHTVMDAPADESAPGRDGAAADHEGLLPLTVAETAELVDMESPLGRSKRFLRLRLPEGTTYRSADHLLIRPANPAALVDRVIGALALAPDRVVVLGATAPGAERLPVDRPMTVRTLLTRFTELGRPATARQAAALAAHTPCPPERVALERLAAEPDGATVPELLERYASCRPGLAELLDVLPPMRLRHYSVSSSPALAPDTADLMVAASPVPHRDGEGVFLGAGAAYLAGLEPGDTVHGRVSPCRDDFRLPADPAVPVLLISAGTGLAPFRAAVADRVAVANPTAAPGTADRDRAPLLCYFGCDHPEVDYLHRAELEEAAASGAAALRPVFSKAPENGARYVQDRLLAESEEVWSLLAAGAHIRVCGDGRAMAPAVRDAFRAICAAHTGASPEEASAWLSGLMAEGRYVEDVWAG